MERKFGARPPSNHAWQMGKTAASIDFVNKAESYIAASENTEEIESLAKAIALIKADVIVLVRPLAVETFLTSNKDIWDIALEQ